MEVRLSFGGVFCTLNVTFHFITLTYLPFFFFVSGAPSASSQNEKTVTVQMSHTEYQKWVHFNQFQQWNQSHVGSGTFFCDSDAMFQDGCSS